MITTSFHFATGFSFSKGGDKKYTLTLVMFLKVRFISINEEKHVEILRGEKKEKKVERMLILSD